MKVMIVASNKSGRYAPFVMDQVKELTALGIDFSFFPITRKGITGYLKSLPELKKSIKLHTPDLIHAHYGLSGLLAGLQRKIPVVVTFHGSDINIKKNRILSKIAHFICAHSIFVSADLKKTLNVQKGSVIPCGIDTDLFSYQGKIASRKKLGLDHEKKFVLFSSSFDRQVKNYPLAQSIMSNFDRQEVELLELKGYTREEIPIIMSAADCGLVTSFSESGPLFIKEAIACRLPVVSVNVGIAKSAIEGTEGNFIATAYDEKEIFEYLKAVLEKAERSVSNGKELTFCNKQIANEIKRVYLTLVAERK